MQLFLSWSGPRSRLIAEALRGWLPKVIQSLKPWMSDEDINAGARWLTDISSGLNRMSVGIICITPENQHNPWLLFEAGALSKTLEQTCVCPLVFEMTPGQLAGPLTQFQANGLTKDGVSKILSTVNKSLGEKQLETRELEEIIDVWWPKLDEKISAIPPAPTPHEVRTTNDQMEELLSLAREQLRRENIRLEASQERDEKLSEMLSFMDHFKGSLSALMSNHGAVSKAMNDVLQNAFTAPAKPSEGDTGEVIDVQAAARSFLKNIPPPISVDLSQMAALTKMMQDMQEKDRARTESMLSFKPKQPEDDGQATN